MNSGFSLLMNITDRCNIRCRHCSNEERLRIGDDLPRSLVAEWIEQAADAGCTSIFLAGGEPFLLLDDLRVYCRMIADRKMSTRVITNGFWAGSREKALEILKSLPGLHLLQVSSDLYHLEFIQRQTVVNAVEACQELKIGVEIAATCANKADKQQVLEIYRDYKPYIFAHSIMPIGNAANLPVERWVLEDKILTLSRFCGIGIFLASNEGEVHACCNSLLFKSPLFRLGNMNQKPLRVLMQEFPNRVAFDFVKRNGPRGIGAIVMESPYYERFRHKSYANICEFCADFLGDREFQEYFLTRIEDNQS